VENERRRWNACLPPLERFLRECPDDALAASASLLCGEASYRRGAHERAIEHLKHVVDRSDDEKLVRPALLRLGEASVALQRWSPALEAFDAHLRGFPGAPRRHEAQFGRGFALENRGQLREAIAAYESVIEAHDGPTAARAQFQIGECLYAMNRHEDAARELLKVDILYAYPEWSAAALYEAGRCFEALDQLDDAAEQYARVVDQHGESEWSRLARQRLDALAPGPLPGRS
jgi:TolA-binding protein